jgi:hypothetical protein
VELCLVSVVISWCTWLKGIFFPLSPPPFLVQGRHGITLRRYLYEVGTGWRSRCTDRYGLERPGFETRWWREILLFSIPSHTGSGAHHPPLNWVSDMALATHPHLEYNHTSASLPELLLLTISFRKIWGMGHNTAARKVAKKWRSWMISEGFWDWLCAGALVNYVRVEPVSLSKRRRGTFQFLLSSGLGRPESCWMRWNDIENRLNKLAVHRPEAPRTQ